MVYEEAVVLTVSFDEAVTSTKEALAEQGFGTLTEIDLQTTLSEKVGKEMGRYVILGACNPQLASRALDVEPQIGVLLPCNVVVRETDRGVIVEALDPGLMAQLVGGEGIAPVADEARRRVGDALQRLAASG